MNFKKVMWLRSNSIIHAEQRGNFTFKSMFIEIPVTYHKKIRNPRKNIRKLHSANGVLSRFHRRYVLYSSRSGRCFDRGRIHTTCMYIWLVVWRKKSCNTLLIWNKFSLAHSASVRWVEMRSTHCSIRGLRWHMERTYVCLLYRGWSTCAVCVCVTCV